MLPIEHAQHQSSDIGVAAEKSPGAVLTTMRFDQRLSEPENLEGSIGSNDGKGSRGKRARSEEMLSRGAATKPTNQKSRTEIDR